MGHVTRQGADELAQELITALRAEAAAYEAEGGTGLNPELVTAWAAGTLEPAAAEAVEWLAEANPIARVQLLDARPEPVPEPSLADALLVKLGKAKEEVRERFARWAGAGADLVAEATALLGDTVSLTRQLRQLPVAGAAFDGGGAGPYLEIFEFNEDCQVELYPYRDEFVVSVHQTGTDWVDETVVVYLEGPRDCFAVEVYLEAQENQTARGRRVLGKTREVIDRLGSDTPQVRVVLAR